MLLLPICRYLENLLTLDRTSISNLSGLGSWSLIPLTSGDCFGLKMLSNVLTNCTNLKIECCVTCLCNIHFVLAALSKLTFFKSSGHWAAANTANDHFLSFQTVKITTPAYTGAWYFELRWRKASASQWLQLHTYFERGSQMVKSMLERSNLVPPGYGSIKSVKH